MKSRTASFLIASMLIARYAIADDAEEHDPVRHAQRMKDCIAENVAKNDGRDPGTIERACEKQVDEGNYKDPNVGLDGMIKDPSP